MVVVRGMRLDTAVACDAAASDAEQHQPSPMGDAPPAHPTMSPTSTILPPLLIDRLWREFSAGLAARLDAFLRRLDDELMAASANALDLARAHRRLVLAQVMRRSGERLRAELLHDLEQDFKRFADALDANTDAPTELAVATEAETERTLALIKVSQGAKAAMPDQLDALDRLLGAHRLAANGESAPWHPRRIAESFHARLEPLPIDVEDQLVLVHLLDRHVLRALRPELTRVIEIFHDAGFVAPETPPRSRATATSWASSGPTGRWASADHDAPGGSSGSGWTRPGEPDWAPLAPTDADAPYRTTVLAAWAFGDWSAWAPGAAAPRDGVAHAATIAAEAARATDRTGHGAAGSAFGPTPSPRACVTPIVVLAQVEQADEPARYEPLVFDLLTGLFEHMFDHARLHPLLRAELSRMQLPIARLAVRDTAFFRDRRHPARRLAAELLQTALRIAPDWSIERCRASALWSVIHSTIDRLVCEAPESAEACRALLETLMAQRDAIDAETAETLAPAAAIAEQRLAVLEQALRDVQQRVADPDVPLDEEARVQLYLAWSELIEAEQAAALTGPPSETQPVTHALRSDAACNTAPGSSRGPTSDPSGDADAALRQLDAYLAGLRERRPLASFAPILASLRQYLDARVPDAGRRARIRQRLASAHLTAHRPTRPHAAAANAATPPHEPPEHPFATPSPPPASATGPAPERGAGRDANDGTTLLADATTVATDTPGARAGDVRPRDARRPTFERPSRPGRDADAFLERARRLHQRQSRRLREAFTERAHDDDPALLSEVFDEALDHVRRLTPGVWIEFRSASGGRCERMKLVWVGVQTERYVFTSADGAAKRTHSAQGLAHELRCARARLVPQEPLFDHVLARHLGDTDRRSTLV